MQRKYIKINKISSAGFTVLELLVTMGIFTLIMGTVLFDYAKFNNDLALSSAAQEIAMAIRQAQTYGLSVKERSVSDSDFASGYGIYFNPTSPKNYYIFSDNNSTLDGRYDGGVCGSNGDCILETGIIRNNITISSVCGTPFGGTSSCPPSAGLTSLNLTFVRPKTNAIIRFNDNSYGSISVPYQTGAVVLSSPKGNTIRVIIENTGQIYIQ